MNVEELDMRGHYHSFVAFDMKSLGGLDINHRLILSGYKVSCW